ncbi:MAG: hypothetical protein AB7N76_22120 [Planctomycetota bacterium]
MGKVDESLFLAAPGGEVLWSGRPEVRPCAADLVAASTSGVAVALVLGLALAAPRGYDLSFAGPLALGYGGVAGAVVLVARVTGAGRVITWLCAFWAVVAVASVYTEQRGAALACPLTSLAVLSAYLGARLRQSRGIRYRITADTAQVGEPGRYTLSFPITHPPRVRRDLFGRELGELDFPSAEATLTTRDGKVFRIAPQARRFRRLLHPDRIVALWRDAKEGKELEPEAS